MSFVEQVEIAPLEQPSLQRFLKYLDAHLRDNGGDATGFFQPLPAGSGLPSAKADAIEAGLTVPVGQPGWRRVWVALATRGRLLGHIDLRARREPFTSHRCLLGMGVHRDHRGQGLGTRMLDHAVRWAEQQPILDWVDLEVISTNEVAVRLYRRSGFIQVGRIDDLFRIEGQSLPSTEMTRLLSHALKQAL